MANVANTTHMPDWELRLRQLHQDSLSMSRMYEINSQVVQMYVHFSRVDIEKDEYTSAVRNLSAAIKLKPKAVDAYFQRGVCYLLQKNYVKAIADFDKLIELKPAYSKQAYVLKSLCYQKVGDIKQSIRELGRALQKWPDFLEARLARGELYVVAKDLEKAMSDFNQVLSSDPDLAVGHLGMGQVFAGYGDNKSALRWFNSAIELQGNLEEAYVKRASVYAALGNSAAAMADLNAAVDCASEEAGGVGVTSEETYFNRGRLLKEFGRQDEALDDLNMAIQQKPDRAESRVLRGRILFGRGEVKLALDDFNIASRSGSEAAKAWKSLCLAILPESKGEANHLRDAIKHSKNDKGAKSAAREAYLMRAHKRARSGLWKGASSDIALTGHDKRGVYLRCICEARQAFDSKDYDAGVKAASRALSDDGESVEALCLRSLCLASLSDGDFQKQAHSAVTDITSAYMNLNSSDSPPILVLRGLILSRLGKYSEAAADFSACISLLGGQNGVDSEDFENNVALLSAPHTKLLLLGCMMAGYSNLKNGALASAVDTLTAALGLAPSVDFEWKCSICLLAVQASIGSGKGVSSALKDSIKAAGADPDRHGWSLIYGGNAKWVLGDVAGAEQCYTNALEIAKGGIPRGTASSYRGQLLLSKGRLELAYTDLCTASRYRPADYVTNTVRSAAQAMSYINSGDFKRAETAAIKLMSLTGEHSEEVWQSWAYLLRGCCRWKLGEPVEIALEDMLKSAEIGSGGRGGAAYANICALLLQMGEVEEALEFAKRALAFSPKWGDLRLLRGLMWISYNKADEAREDFKYVLESKPALLDTYFKASDIALPLTLLPDMMVIPGVQSITIRVADRIVSLRLVIPFPFIGKPPLDLSGELFHPLFTRDFSHDLIPCVAEYSLRAPK
jgi:tetratricopeptide (TPR) repeat protein